MAPTPSAYEVFELFQKPLTTCENVWINLDIADNRMAEIVLWWRTTRNNRHDAYFNNKLYKTKLSLYHKIFKSRYKFIKFMALLLHVHMMY